MLTLKQKHLDKITRAVLQLTATAPKEEEPCPIAYVDSDDGNLLCEIELIVDAQGL